VWTLLFGNQQLKSLVWCRLCFQLRHSILAVGEASGCYECQQMEEREILNRRSYSPPPRGVRDVPQTAFVYRPITLENVKSDLYSLCVGLVQVVFVVVVLRYLISYIPWSSFTLKGAFLTIFKNVQVALSAFMCWIYFMIYIFPWIALVGLVCGLVHLQDVAFCILFMLLGFTVQYYTKSSITIRTKDNSMN
jgi:hypothetical protein